MGTTALPDLKEQGLGRGGPGLEKVWKTTEELELTPVTHEHGLEEYMPQLTSLSTHHPRLLLVIPTG